MKQVKQILPQKAPIKFSCELCDYSTSKKRDYERHLLTAKHKMKQNETQKASKSLAGKCEFCNADFFSRTTLWRHKKKCTHQQENTEVLASNNKIDASLVLDLIKQNRELQQQLIVSNQTINNNTINNNQKFNINIFLNEQCKNAINFSDFIEKIQVSHDDLENNARLGFVQGMTKIITDNLNQLTLYQRPIHCTDVKRDKMYIRDENKWEREQEKVKEKIYSGIREICCKSIGSLNDWKHENPDYENIDSDFSNKCLTMQRESFSMGHENYSKVTRNIAKESKIQGASNFENQIEIL